MDYKIELSPSNRAKCHVCKNTIDKGTPRAVTIVRGQFTSKKLTCQNCFDDEVDKRIEDLKEMKIKFKEMKNGKAM